MVAKLNKSTGALNDVQTGGRCERNINWPGPHVLIAHQKCNVVEVVERCLRLLVPASFNDRKEEDEAREPFSRRRQPGNGVVRLTEY